jgi:Flp pilus assembly protein TadG
MTKHPSRFLVDRARNLARRLKANDRGSVLMITGLGIVVLIFATGMGIDYSRAMKLQTKLNAAADAAALAAVTQTMMNDPSTDDASAAARNMFKSQINDLQGLVWPGNDVDSNVQISVVGPDFNTSTRTAIVTYAARSTNAFAGILQLATLPIHGTSTATATSAPNIDFYISLDTSPSMALPTTSSGFTTMDNAFSCAFACHSNKIEAYYNSSIKKGLIVDNNAFNIVKGSFPDGAAPTIANGPTPAGTATTTVIDSAGSYIYKNSNVADTIASNATSGNGTSIRTLCKATSSNKNICVYNKDGTFVDSYWYALNQGVPLRVTDERQAIKDLMSLATTYQTINQRSYRAALYTFDHATDLKQLSWITDSDSLASVSAAAGNVNVVQVNDRAGNGCQPGVSSCSSSDTYRFTSFKSIMDKMASGQSNGGLPAISGGGTQDLKDTPQAYLFIVTDGMSDEYTSAGPYQRTRSYLQPAQLAQCTDFKTTRKVHIAILYTEYTTDSIQDDEPSQRGIATTAIQGAGTPPAPPNIASQLTACASPGLMYTVKTNESISTALQNLFTKALATAHLSK